MSMSGSMGLDDWFVDEVGITFGVIGPWRLKTVYEPVYERRGDMLNFVALRATSALERGGRPIEPNAVGTLLTAGELWQARRLAGELAIRNLVLADSEEPVPTTIVPVAFPPDRLAAGLDHLVRLANLAEVGVEKLVFDLSGTDPLARGRALSRPGLNIRHALDLASAAEICDTQERPEILRVPEEWARRLLSSGQLALQMRRLATVLGRDGRHIQLEGVNTPGLLRAALSSGAERLHGVLLAPSIRAGTEPDRRSLSIPELLSRGDTGEGIA